MHTNVVRTLPSVVHAGEHRIEEPQSWAVSSDQPRPDPTVEVDGWPRWLARLALTDFCSIDVLGAVARSAGVEVSRGLARALIANMERAGLLRESGVSGVFLLRKEATTWWVAELERGDAGIEKVRTQLASAGLVQPGRIGPRLAALALGSGDWAGSEAVWRLYPTGDLMADPKVRAGYAGVPNDLRAKYPGLSVAAAIASSYDVDSDRLDLDRMATALIRDGRTLHGGWQEHSSPEAKVVAGTLSLLAQAAMPGSVAEAPAGLEAQTLEKLVQVIRDASLSQAALTARALTLFHAAVALISLLRGDWSKARKEAEYALILNDGCGVPGFLAALVIGLSCAVAGDSQGSAVAEAFLAEHTAHGCRPHVWLEGVFHLVHASTALRELDRDAARHHLRLHDLEASHTQWLSARPLHAVLLSTAAILWDDPEHALARFDSLVPGLVSEDRLANSWAWLLLRSRAELLLALGAVSQAERIICELTATTDSAVSFVPAAWFDLCAGRLSDALAKADEGIFESRVSLADRAFLYAVKSGALLQAGAADELVGSAATAACLTCERAGTLVPFAVLPGPIRSRLVAEHRTHHADDRCYLSRAVHNGAFEQLKNATLDAPTALKLTRREEILLPLLATAASVPEIANQQFVSVNTLRKQVVTLRQKFGAASRDDLVRKAHEAGLLNRTAKSWPRMDGGEQLPARADFGSALASSRSGDPDRSRLS